MLERVQAEIGKIGSLAGSANPEDTALILRAIRAPAPARA